MIIGFNGMMDYGFGVGWMLFGSIFMILFWVAVILLIVWLYKQITGDKAAQKADTALDILRMRYAKGEINKEEFDRMKRDLEG